MSNTRETLCKFCQTKVTWCWNFTLKKAYLTNEHGNVHDCGSHKDDVFPGWCKKCNASNLVWIRKQNHMELTEEYGLPHTCPQDDIIHDMSFAHCKHCNAKNLMWIDKCNRFTLVNTNGEKHSCVEYTTFMSDWAEANRINYALEKKWLKSIPDGTLCKKCNGRGYTSRLSNNKRLWKKFNSTEPITVLKKCKKCKNMGTFSKPKKQLYLKALRKRYWPFYAAIHKWKGH